MKGIEYSGNSYTSRNSCIYCAIVGPLGIVKLSRTWDGFILWKDILITLYAKKEFTRILSYKQMNCNVFNTTLLLLPAVVDTSAFHSINHSLN